MRLFFLLLPMAALLIGAQSPKSAAKAALKQAIEEKQDALEYLKTALPKDNEVCFSPDEPCEHKLKRLILSARESIDVAIFDLSNKAITDALIEQAKKIKVRLVLDKLQSREKHGKLDRIKESKVQYRFGKQKGIMHNKFTIIDRKMIETGSFNYTYRATKANQENQIYLSNPSIVQRYQERFELMWKHGKER